MNLLGKISTNARVQKWIARALLLAGVLAGGAWLAALDYGKKISTNVLDLIPQNERAPELAVVRSLAGEKQARVALFELRVPGADEEKRDEAAYIFAAALRDSGAFAEVELHGDTASRNALGKQIFEQRLNLLLPGWLAVGAPLATPGSNASARTEDVAENAAAALEKFMARPEAAAFGEIIGADPLLLLPSLIEKVQALDPSSAENDSAAAPPDDANLIWALTRGKPLEASGQQPVFAAVENALDAVRAFAPQATLRWTAISRFAAESRALIESEMTWLNILSLAAVLCVAVLCLRKILKALHLAPVILGSILGAWVAVTFFFDRVHVLVFVVGSLLAGVAIDYGFYLYLQPRKFPGEPYAGKVRRLMKPLLGSALTTVIGFSLLLFSDLPLIRQLGVFVSAGLLCALVTAILWFAQIKDPWMDARGFANAQVRANKTARRIALGLLAAGVLIALAGPWRLHWRDNIRDLEVPTPALTAEATELRAHFGDSPSRTVYLTRGDTVAKARESLEKFLAWHDAHFPGTAAASLGQAIPLRADYDALPGQLEQLRGFPAALHDALVRHGFNAGEFAPFFETWKNFAASARPGYDELVSTFSSSLGGQTALLMSATPGACFFVTIASHPPAAEPPAALATVSLNQLESLNKLFSRYRLSALRLSLIGLALVGLSMWVIYGVWRGSRIFATPVGSCLFAFGALGVFGATLNLFHLLGAFLGVCLSHNYAIFTAENDARGEHPPPSIRLSALSTAASFGVLATSRIPVVSALGSTVALIVLSALVIVELKRIAASPRIM